MPWDGTERRKMSQDDHDLLTRIDANLLNFMDSFHAHIKEDEKLFSQLKKKTDNHDKFIWGVIAIVGAIEFVFKLLK